MLARGTNIAGYEVDRFIAQGGMGVVYSATQTALDRRVALKLIAPDLACDAEFRRRFQTESRLAAAIEHPNVIPVYEAGDADGQLFIAMRFIEGIDLGRELQTAGRLEPRRAARIVAQLGDALDAAHKRGLVHRDVKPANVMMADEHAYLTDFGLVKDMAGGGQMTTTGQWVGTPDYVAPEQFKGEPVDARTDVYALGCVLFHILTGEVPFPRDQAVAKLWAHSQEDAPHASELVPGLPPELDDVIARAMAKQPEDRYQSAGDLGRAAVAAAQGRSAPAEALSVARGDAAPDTSPAATAPKATALGRDDAPTAVREPTPTRPSGDGGGRPKWLLPAGIAAALIAVAVVLVVVLSGGSSSDDKTPPPKTTAAKPAASGPVVTAKIPIGGQLRSVAAGGGSVWVIGRGGTLIRVDAKTNKRVGTSFDDLRVGDAGSKIIYAFGAVWATVRNHGQDTGELIKIDAATGKPTGDKLKLGHRVLGLTAGPDVLWVTYSDDDEVVRIDPDTVKPIGKPTTVDKGPFAIAADKDFIWVTQFGHKPKLEDDPGGGVVKIIAPDRPKDPTSKPAVTNDVFDAGPKPLIVTFGAGKVWAASAFNTIGRIDPVTGEVLKTFPNSFDGLGDLAGDDKNIYAVGWQHYDKELVRPVVARLDPATGKVMGKPAVLGDLIPTTDLNINLTIGEGSLWATVRGVVYRIKV